MPQTEGKRAQEHLLLPIYIHSYTFISNLKFLHSSEAAQCSAALSVVLILMLAYKF